MCDDGRVSYKYLNSERVLVAREGRGAQAKALGREAATEHAAAALAPHARAGSLGVLLSPLASLEDLLAAATVAKEALGVSEVFVGGRDGWQDGLKRADENPNRRARASWRRRSGSRCGRSATSPRRSPPARCARCGRSGPRCRILRPRRRSRAPRCSWRSRRRRPGRASGDGAPPGVAAPESDGTFVNFGTRAAVRARVLPARRLVRTGCSRPSSAARWGSCTARDGA